MTELSYRVNQGFIRYEIFCSTILINALDHVVMTEIDQSFKKCQKSAETIPSKINGITDTKTLEFNMVRFSLKFCTDFI